MFVLLAMALAAATPALPARPPDGTYAYTLTAGGVTIETDVVVISSSVSVVSVRDAAGIPVRSITAIATATYDPNSLIENGYTADFNLPSGTQHTDTTFRPGVISVRVPGQTVDLKADPSAPLELVTDNLAGTAVMIPAVLHANQAEAVTLAVLTGGLTIPFHAATAQNAARPHGVPATDRSLTFQSAQLQEIYWFDPATYLVHAVEIPSQNAEIRLTSSTAGAVAPVTPAPLVKALPTPVPHFTSEEVTFRSRDGTRLAGTLTVPQNAGGRVPAVILVHGSGAQDRDETVGPNPVFLQLSNALSNAGYAVLRYDKRGVDKSEGNAASMTRDQLIADVTAAYAFARSLPVIDSSRVFLLGHSEGGELVPSVAATHRGVAGIILMAPPALPLGQVIMQQVMDSVPPSQRAAARREETTALQKIRSGQAKGRGMAWVRTSLDIDPVIAIKQVHAPILILQGGGDIQVLPHDLPRLVAAARSANHDVTARVFPGDNHLFMKIASNEPNTPQAALHQYLTVPSYIDPAVLRTLVSWLNARRSSRIVGSPL